MQLTAEDSFVLQCVRAVVGRKRIDRDNIRPVDWGRLAELARRHQVEPFVYEAIQAADCENRLPGEVRTQLLLEYHKTGMRNAYVRKRLGEALDEASRKGIRVMLLKGAVLAYGYYPRPELRALGDIDLLIREEDFRGLRGVLELFGYQSSVPQLRESELPRYAHCFQQIRFQSRHVPPLEVHFRLLNLGMAGRSEPAWEDARPLEFGDARIWSPSPERFLLHLCLHAQQHAFALLRLFVDIAVWQRAHPVDAERFVALARRHHLATPAYYALTYTADLLGLPDSDLLRSRLQPPTWKRRLFERLWHDGQVRSLTALLGSMEAELPRAFLLGEAPIRGKAVFLWNVLLPPSSWLDSSNGSATRRRLRHVSRILSGARRGLLGTNTART